MDAKEKKQYRKVNLSNRKMQLLYGMKMFSLPMLYKLRNRAYSAAFHFTNIKYLGYDIFIYREHNSVGKISVDCGTIIQNHVIIDYSGSVLIGKNVHISDGVKIYSHNHDLYSITHNEPSFIPQETVIGDNVWIGANAIILPGVKIETGSVVGAGAVVTHNVTSGSVVAGNPAKVIKSI